MKNTYKYSLALPLLCLAIESCGIWATKTNTGATTDKRTLAESKFDPLSGEGDGDIITADVPPARESDTSGYIAPLPRESGIDQKDDQFFSVLLFTSKSNSEAKEFKDSIASLFENDVRIDYQAPYYRVCVGEAEGFELGEQLLKHVNAMGFPRAWLVRVRK
jgi:hypothetical protein